VATPPTRRRTAERDPGDAPDLRPVRPPDARVYGALGVVGIVLFVAGVVIPILAWVPNAEYVRIAVAAVGGGLAVFGLGRWNYLRSQTRGKEPPASPGAIRGLPSLEYFSPERPAAPAPDEEQLATVVGIVGILLLLVVSGLTVLPGTSAAPPAAPSAVVAAASAGPTPTCFPGVYPVYTPLNGFNPPLPTYSTQSPCKVAQDEVHATFSSGAAGSGESVKVPIRIPGGVAPGAADLYRDFYVGMVVQGNPTSVDGQSYAEVVFTPYVVGSHVEWRVGVAVWSLLLNTACAVKSWGPTGFNLTYSGQYACVVDETGNYNGTVLEAGIPGGQEANVTMTGSATSSSRPLGVWFNDSTNASESASFSLTAANTHTDEFRPYYGTACPDNCVLNWTNPFGLGVGLDLCDSGSCFSYNQSTLVATPPFEVGAPEYWTGISYSGTYLYLSPESSTGACSGIGSVAPCSPNAFAGYYPYFSFNGTRLNFGGNYSWATESWGGAYQEFNAYGTMNDYLPLFVDELTNSSRAGYVAPGVALNVSARVQVLGRLASVNLSYANPGVAAVNETIDKVSGSATDAIYAADIPSAPENGTVVFRVIATDAAGGVTAAPPYPDPNSTVLRGPIPSFSLVLDTSPPICGGGISVNGTALAANGTVAEYLAGEYPVRAESCYPYAFDRWQTSGGASVAPDAASGVLTLTGNGTVDAEWTYVTPDDQVGLAWNPAGCGATTLNGNEFLASGGPQSTLVRNRTTESLGAATCGGDAFAGWTISNPSNLTVLGTQVTVTGNGTLTETSLPTTDSLPVLFETDPTGCGGVRVNGAGYTNNESLNLRPSTAYDVGPDPCYGWGWNGTVATTGGVSISGGTLLATNPGTVTYSYYQLTLVSVVTSPGDCGAVDWDGVTEYNGATLNVTNHTLHSLSALPCAGHYLETWDISGAITYSSGTVDVNGPGTIEAIFHSGSPEATVEFITEPIGCGSINFAGTMFSNAQSTTVSPGSVESVLPTACANYGFVAWNPSGGVQVAGGVVYVNASGSLEAEFHPLVPVHIDTSPTDCGSIAIAGVDYTNGSVPQLPEDWNYPIAAVPCAHDTLDEWETSTSATIANGSLALNGSAVITAVYVAALYPVEFYLDPGNCGSLLFGGTAYGNNSTLNLTAGVYPIAPGTCAGYALSSWATTGGLNVTGATLTVNGAGSVTEVEAAVPPSLSLAVPSSAASGSAVVLRANVAVPVPPYNYNYTWSFGDGTNVTTPSNFTSHTYAAPGTYEVRVTVVDPLGRTASAVANVTVVNPGAAPVFDVSPADLAVIGGAIVVVAAAIVAALILARRNQRPPEPEPVTPSTGDPDLDAFPPEATEFPSQENL
jgi:hypothetical protein